jgi:hypothetical protein
VQIGGAFTKATVFGCCIHDGSGAGVFIGGRAQAELEKNNIHSHALSCVQVQDEGSEAILRGNRIYHGAQAGVYVFDKAKATLENNSIRSHLRAGIRVDDCCEVMMTGNRICDGKANGVLIGNDCTCVLEANIIADNDCVGVGMYQGTATLTNNTIKGNGQCHIRHTAEQRSAWHPSWTSAYQSGGFAGLWVHSGSSLFCPPGSNTIEGNGKVGYTIEQVFFDKSCTALSAPVFPSCSAIRMEDFASACWRV